jgi:hypothetical protein
MAHRIRRFDFFLIIRLDDFARMYPNPGYRFAHPG